MLIFQRINILHIFSKHFGTFINERNNKFCWLEVFTVFLIFPICFVFGIEKYNFTFKSDFYTNLIQIFAIVGGFLINTVVMIADKKMQLSQKSLEKNRILISETYYNIIFGIVVCVLTCLVCAASFLWSDSDANTLPTKFFTSTVLILIWIFVHTILMVLKRLASIFAD